MKTPADIRMHALAFLYDHLDEFPIWIRRLTPGQMDNIAKLLLAWHRTIEPSCEILPMAEVEKREIIRAISICNGDVVRAADALRIGKTTLYRKMREWGYSIEDRTLIHQASALAEIPVSAEQTNGIVPLRIKTVPSHSG